MPTSTHDDIADKDWHNFLALCMKAHTQEDLNALLELFLTSQERTAISTRYAIIAALLKGEKTQREIAKSIPISIAKITRGSNSLKQIGARLTQFLTTHIASS